MFELPHNLGDYTLNQAIGIKGRRHIFLAEQKGTERHVALELLPEDEAAPDEVDAFLEEVRVKTLVSEKLPFLGTVYEAQKRDGMILYTYQHSDGTSLAELAANGQTLDIENMLNILDIMAKACIGFESLGISNRDIQPEDIKIKGNKHIFLENIAIPGPRRQGMSEQTMKSAGVLMLPFITTGAPGATRMQTLLGWMANGSPDGPLAWEQIRELIHTFREQMGLSSDTERFAATRQRRKKSVPYIIAGAVLLMGAVALILHQDDTVQTDPPPQPAAPLLSRLDHTYVDVQLPSGEVISCDAHEVTIQAYQNFLAYLEKLPEHTRMTSFKHPGQPEDKISYVPEQWDGIIEAAKNNEDWNGLKLSMDSPVFNVDWWDAYAYSTWKKRRLPTKDEWLAIAEIAGKNLKGDPYSPVAAYRNDIGKDNLCGFSSGLSEWTETLEKKPSQPEDPEQRVVCGGNYRLPDSTAVTYEPDDGAHSATLGFRTVATVSDSNN